MNLDSCVQFRLFYMHVVELSLEGNIPSLFCGDGICCCTFSGYWSKSYICSYLTTKFKTLAPSWAIFDALAHLIYAHAKEKLVVLDQI